MGQFLIVMAAFGGVLLMMTVVFQLANRAILKQRPGWGADSEPGIRCPHAVGEKGEPGPPGEEIP